MGDEITVRVEINQTYAWKQQDLSKIPPSIEKIFIPFAGDGYRVTASMRREGTPAITHNHPSLASWNSALSPDWDSLEIDINSPDYARGARIVFRPKEKEINVSINMLGNDHSALQALLAEFERSMASDVGAPKVRRWAELIERVDGQYQLDYPEDVTWLKKILENIETWVGPYDFSGSYSLISAPQFRRYPKLYEQWKTDCEVNYKNLSECQLRLTGQSRECSFRYYASRGEVNISLGAVDQREIVEFSATLQKQLPIRVLNDPSLASPQGQRRRYFATEQIDAQWFERFMNQLMKVVNVKLNFQGFFGEPISADDGPTVDSVKFGNYEEWYEQIQTKWNDVVWIRCWISAPRISITLDIDLLRDLVTLELESPDQETVKKIYDDFESTQKVKKIQGNPYRYRKFMRQFKITKWTSARDFAQALRDAAQFVFPGRTPGRRVAIQTSYLTLGDIEEDLQPFSTFEQFCQGVAATPELNRAHLVLEGPEGVLLGVELDRKKESLIVRTSVERKRLEGLLDIFKNAVELSLQKVQDEEGKKSKEDKVNSALVFTSAISIICVLITGAVAVLNSGGGVSSLSDRYTLDIVYPQGKAGEIVDLPGPDFRVQWKLTRKNILGETVDLKSNASVEAVRDGSPQPQTFGGHEGAAVLRLDPGQYQINVISNIDNSTMNTVRVKVAEPKPEQKPPVSDKAVKRGNKSGNS
jgi:hypothetical protein